MTIPLFALYTLLILPSLQFGLRLIQSIDGKDHVRIWTSRLFWIVTISETVLCAFLSVLTKFEGSLPSSWQALVLIILPAVAFWFSRHYLKASIKRSLFLSLTYLALQFICEPIAYVIIPDLRNFTDMSSIRVQMIGAAGISLVMTTATLVWTGFRRFLSNRLADRHSRWHRFLEPGNQFRLYIALILMLLVGIYAFLTWITSQKNLYPDLEIVTLFLVTAIAFSLLLLAYRVKTQQQQLLQFEKDMNALSEYAATLDSLHEETRRYRHDMNNILMGLRDALDRDDLADMRRYFHSHVMAEYERRPFSYVLVSQLMHVEPRPLKGLLFSKLEQAHRMGLDVRLELLSPIRGLPLTDIDACRIFGILIDNAVEAAMQSPERMIGLSTSRSDGTLDMQLYNSCGSTVDAIAHLSGGGSSKGPGRGLGLTTARSLLSKCRGSELILTAEEAGVTCQLLFHGIDSPRDCADEGSPCEG